MLHTGEEFRHALALSGVEEKRTMPIDDLMYDLIEIGFSFNDALTYTNKMLWDDCLQRERENASE